MFSMKGNDDWPLPVFHLLEYSFRDSIAHNRGTSPAVHKHSTSVPKGKKNCVEKSPSKKREMSKSQYRSDSSDTAVCGEEGDPRESAVSLPWANTSCTWFHPPQPCPSTPGHCPADATF